MLAKILVLGAFLIQDGTIHPLLEGMTWHFSKENLALCQYVEERFQERELDNASKFCSHLINRTQALEIDPLIVLAIIETESHFNPLVVGAAGEIGLMQIKPSTAKWISQKSGLNWNGRKSLFDPITNLEIGLIYLHYLKSSLQKEDPHFIVAYNIGIGRLLKHLSRGENYPKSYYYRVQSRYEELTSKI